MASTGTGLILVQLALQVWPLLAPPIYSEAKFGRASAEDRPNKFRSVSRQVPTPTGKRS